MLELQNVSLRLPNGKYLIRNLSFALNPGDRMALIGEEGNGKTTLLTILAANNSPGIELFGSVHRQKERIGWLKQSLSDEELKMTPRSYLSMELGEQHLQQMGGDWIRTLHMFGLSREQILSDRILYTFSGGEQVKIQLLRLMYGSFTVLLLDEPTNNLDLDTLSFFEDFMIKETRPILFVSHDEWLLSSCANRVLHLEHIKKKQEERWTLFNGGYDEYINNRQMSFNKQDQVATYERRKRKEKIDKLQQIRSKVEYQQNQAVRNPTLGRLLKKRMHVILSQERRMEREPLTPYAISEEEIDLRFPPSMGLPSRRRVLELVDLSISREGKTLSKNINLTLMGNRKMAIIGRNGVGKTTLIREILSHLQANQLRVGWMPQVYSQVLPLDKTPVEYLSSIAGYDKTNQIMIRNHLGALHFRPEEMITPIRLRSGGQQAKIILLSLVLRNPDILVLDEPTRNLSPLALPTIRALFASFPGPILAVSHDRAFLASVFDEIWELTEVGLYQLTEIDSILQPL
jgi:ATPase subunit of ABC transporter with duplicated ATPase domains